MTLIPDPNPVILDFREPWSAGELLRDRAAIFDVQGVQVGCGAAPVFSRRIALCVTACRGVKEEVLRAGLSVLHLIQDAADVPKMTDALSKICLRAGNLAELAAICPWSAADLLQALQEVAQTARAALA